MFEAIFAFALGAGCATSICWYLWHADARDKQGIADELAALKAKFLEIRDKG